MSRMVLGRLKGYETRMRIVAAITDIARTTDIEKIAVRDICEQAEISRQTFYRYFKDRYDVLSWYSELDGNNSVLQIGRIYTWSEGCARMFQFVAEEADFYAVALKPSDDYNSLAAFSERAAYNTWSTTIAQINSYELTPPLDYELKAWCHLTTFLSYNWAHDIDSGQASIIDLPDVIENLLKCIPAGLIDIMDTPVLAKRRKTGNAPPGDR